MSFNIQPTNKTTEFNELVITINNHNPPKRITLMDTNWTCNGYTLREKGGPFYIAAFKRRDEIMATFTGKYKKKNILPPSSCENFYC